MSGRPSKSMKNKPRPLTVAGVMSGTSADGVDVAICRIAPGRRPEDSPRLKVLAHRGFAYPKAVRAAVLAAAGAQEPNSSSVPELARLSWRLGELYAKCVEETVRESGLRLDLVALHGQTIYHQPAAERYAGEPVRCTWQTGEPAVIAERLRTPVVSDFRTADLAAGGQGAPLVPMLDFCSFRHARKNRVLLNLGGIANLTALPAGCTTDQVLAFDTGPANMVIDLLMQRLYGRGYDRHGAVAARGKVLEDVIDKLLKERYFHAPPPKSCGREQFGASFADKLQGLCSQAGGTPEDAVATATALTARSIVEAYARWCWPHLGILAPGASSTELLASGGGAQNRSLMGMLAERFHALGVAVRTTDSAGISGAAKEAAAFALLGWLTWNGLPGNIPAATGAGRSVVLGRLTLWS